MSEPIVSESNDEAPAGIGVDDWLNDVNDDGDQEVDEAATDTKDGEAEAEKPADPDEAGKEGEQPPKPDEGEPAKVEPDADKPKDEAAVAKEAEDAAAEQKRQNDEFAKARIREKQALRVTADSHIKKAESELEAAGDDEVKQELAKIHAREAQRDADDFIRNVESNQSVMQNDHSRALHDIPLFNPEAKEYKEGAYELALEHLAPHLVTQNLPGADGEEQLVILGSNVSVYDFLTKEAKSLESLVTDASTKAAIEGQQAEQKMRGAAEPGHGAAPRSEPKEDKESREMKEAFAAV